MLHLALPLVGRADVDLARNGDDLVVTVGSYRRLLTVPAGLARHRVAGARVEDGELQVRFVEQQSAEERGRSKRDESQDPVGSAAEEAAKLLGAVADWARDHGSDLGGAGPIGGLADQVSAAAHDVDAHLATGEDCRYCPLCRAVQVYRAASPEVREHLVGAASVAGPGRRGRARDRPCPTGGRPASSTST